jgi:hypothetical protein
MSTPLLPGTRTPLNSSCLKAMQGTRFGVLVDGLESLTSAVTGCSQKLSTLEQLLMSGSEKAKAASFGL